MTLNQYKLGSSGIIERLDFPSNQTKTADHLSQLGLRSGTEFEVVGLGFNGDPIAIQLSNNRIAIGKSDAEFIFTRKV